MSIRTSKQGLADLDRRITALEQDIGSCACLSAADLDRWAEWRDDARAYLRRSNDRISGLENALSAGSLGGVLGMGIAEMATDREADSIEAETTKWASELATWAQMAAARGASLTTPGLPPGLSLPWATIGAVAALALVVGAGVYVVARERTKLGGKLRRNPGSYTVIGKHGERWHRTKEGAVAAALANGESANGPRGWLVFRGKLVCD